MTLFQKFRELKTFVITDLKQNYIFSISPFLPLFYPPFPAPHKTRTNLQASAQLWEAHTWGAVSGKGAIGLVSES